MPAGLGLRYAFLGALETSYLNANGIYQENNENIYELRHGKTSLMPYANNRGTDQSAHPRSLISAFIVRCLDSMTHILDISKISRL